MKIEIGKPEKVEKVDRFIHQIVVNAEGTLQDSIFIKFIEQFRMPED